MNQLSQELAELITKDKKISHTLKSVAYKKCLIKYDLLKISCYIQYSDSGHLFEIILCP